MLKSRFSIFDAIHFSHTSFHPNFASYVPMRINFQMKVCIIKSLFYYLSSIIQDQPKEPFHFIHSSTSTLHIDPFIQSKYTC